MLHFLTTSYTYQERYGQALIIVLWNYPFQLNIAPLIAAIAAGNCAVLKPSELSPATSRVIARIISENFHPSYIAVFKGGVEETKTLLEEKFDYIFFTGGTTLSFGGIGNSGMCLYHGKAGFETFSHQRSIIVENRDD